LKKKVPHGAEILFGPKGLIRVATDEKTDIIVSSIVGAAGIEPTIAALKKGKRIALANKEVLVAAGEYMSQHFHKQLLENIIPVDSEHSAIAQSLRGEEKKSMEKIILTASGGPFLNTPREDFRHITPAMALAHPNWNMGNKITVDSATMMNKGLEVIEARWLFNVEPKNIQILIHPESIIHSMVQFLDGSIIGQMNVADMRIPIQFALSYPERIANEFPRVDFPRLRTFHFFEPDFEKFPLIKIAYECLEKGNIFPAVMNAANEVAVENFLKSKITFDKISVLIKDILLSFKEVKNLTLEKILDADRRARSEAKNWLDKNRCS
ncbi:MAG: 1-deoxy-D-xylulose-5-phosphate reductoisomerase, partial [Candidatus Aureabacteria bacterium]|nr:1-deoxy-D-xylulose-5-phosphate reductoisomerase [Candidatus Auribacterota bacterium]